MPVHDRSASRRPAPARHTVELAAAVTPDEIQRPAMTELDSGFMTEIGSKQGCQLRLSSIAATQVRNGLTVIADAANQLEVGRDIWRNAAKEASVLAKVIELVCSDAALHRQRLAVRHRGPVAYPEPSWDDVVRRADETEPWTCDRLVLDSAQPFEDNIDKAVGYLGG